MAAIQDILIENLLSRLEEEPDNRVLIGIAHDALLEAGREKEAEELECRCWLKAKGRMPSHWIWPSGRIRYCFEQEKSAEHLDQFFQIVPNDLTNEDFIGSSVEECVDEVVSNWLRIKRKRKDKLWLWEPPT